MPRPYSTDLRERVVRTYEAQNHSFAQIAERFDLGVATVNRWVSRHRRTGCVEPLAPGGRLESLVDELGLSLLCTLLWERPDATRLELAQEYQRERGVALSVATVGRELRRLGFTRKKRLSMPPSVRMSG